MFCFSAERQGPSRCIWLSGFTTSFLPLASLTLRSVVSRGVAILCGTLIPWLAARARAFFACIAILSLLGLLSAGAAWAAVSPSIPLDPRTAGSVSGLTQQAGSSAARGFDPPSGPLYTPTVTPTPQSCGTIISFDYPDDYNVGQFPRSIAAGHFNGDSFPDLVTANFMSDNLSVLLGNGDRTFQQALNSPGVNTPDAVASGDFNGDGNTDLASVSSNDNNVAVLRGNGDGTFQAPTYYTVVDGPDALATGDVNGDDRLDLITGNSNNLGGVSVLLGNGDGTFQQAVYYSSGHALSVALGNFNGDSYPDIVTANWTDQSVSVLLNNGNGTFGEAAYYTVEPNPRSVAMGDFNGDGYLDLTTADNDNTSTVAVLIGNGNGTFQQAVYYSVGANPVSVAAGDFNGDSHPDIVAANNLSGDVSVLKGNGNGTFAQPVGFVTVGAPYSVTTGDFNHDGRLDIATAEDGADNVSVLINTCSLTPTPTRTITSTPTPTLVPVHCEVISFAPSVDYNVGNSPRSVAAADFNGDGSPDLVTANYSGSNISMLLNSGNGTFPPAASHYVGGSPVAVAVGDFNADDHPDIVISSSDGVLIVQLNNANGSGNFHTAFQGLGGVFTEVGDVNGDSRLDLIAVDDYNDTVNILRGNGDGTFQAAAGYPTGDNPSWVAVGEFNADNYLDLVTANTNSSGGVSVLLGNGDGTFQAAVGYPTGSMTRAVVAGDFDRDGHIDIAAANPGQSNISVLLGNGDGTFDTATNYPVGGDPRALVGGDFNGDGRLDLAATEFLGSGIAVLKGNGDGSFAPAQSFEVSYNPTSAVASDLNGDGKQDFAVSGQAYNKVSVLLNSCVPLIGTSTPSTVATGTATGTATRTATRTRTATSTITGMLTSTSTSTPTATSTRAATTTFVPEPTSCAVQFTDVLEGSTFYPFVRCMACRGIISGYASGCETGNPCFRPNNNVTRGQLSKIVANAAGFNEPAGGQQYEDVPQGSTFFDVIWRLANRGYVSGYPCGGVGEPCGSGNLPYFRPNGNATRGQISKIDSNAAGFSDTPTGQQFEDMAAGSTYYTYTYRLVSRAIMSGYPCGGTGEPCGGGNLPYFRPNNNATRGQTSKIVSNTFFPSCQTPVLR